MEEATQQNQNTDQETTHDDWQQKAHDHLAGWKRALADYENLRRETDQIADRRLSLFKTEFALEFLNFYDNFLLAIEHIPSELRSSSWVTGLDHIKRQADELLKRLGLEVIAAEEGTAFDHSFHEAVETSSDPKVADQLITRVISNGYRLHDQVVRPARVVVNTKS